MLIGHEQVLSRLGGGLPPVATFVGPASVGKWTAAEEVRREHAVVGADVFRARSMTMDEARAVVRFASTAAAGRMKLTIARLDRATSQSMTVLLKTLEDSHSSVRFILVSENVPPRTIASRSEVFDFPLLTEAQVVQVLLAHGKSLAEAQLLASRCGGQVARALKLASGNDVKITVLAAIRALAERDARVLDTVASRWTDEHTMLLEVWCREVITGRWRIFAAGESEVRGTAIPMRILMALKADVRPKLVVRAGLMGVLRAA